MKFYLVLFALLVEVVIIAFDHDYKVAYVDTLGECKYTEVNGKFYTCKLYDNTYEKVYVAPCLKKVNKDGVKSSDEKCRMSYEN